MRWTKGFVFLAAIACAIVGMTIQIAHAADKKPNILVIWGDDIGISNVSAYSDGLMGYETPNITFGESEHEYIF